MCLAVPMKIIEIEGDTALAEARGVIVKVNISLVPDVKVNDKVIIHAGFAIEKLDPEDARKTEELWDEYDKISGGGVT